MGVTRRDLDTVPALLFELATSLAQRGRKVPAARGSRPTSPLPYNVAASDAETRLRQVLSGWVLLVSDERGAPIPVHRSFFPAFLAEHSNWLRSHPAAPEFVTEVREAVAAAGRVIDVPPAREYVCQCGECDTSVYCQRGDIVARCRRCGARYDVDEARTAMLAASRLHTDTAARLASLLTVMEVPTSAAGIRSMAHRGKLEPVAPGEYPPRYRLGDVLDVLTERERKRASLQRLVTER